MRGLASRLRAALTPQLAALLAALMLVYLAAGSREDSLEKRIARTLSQVDGAGRVEVTIRMKETVSDGGAFAAAAKAQIPSGAVAVAQGADDPLVAIALQDALCALLNLPPSSVSVMTGGR